MSLFFQSARVNGEVPPPHRDYIDVAVLDMNHSWPNVGHDSLIRAIREVAEPHRETLLTAGVKVRAISFDIRRHDQMPSVDRFKVFVGSGGPGHLDPRLNDGVAEWSQGIAETAEWETPLFRLFDEILADSSAALFAVCHSFGLLCRWSGAARVVLRTEKSSGMPTNVLTDSAVAHPWFGEFARRLPDGRHFRVIDNRLFDLIVVDDRHDDRFIAYEGDDSNGLTMLELARDVSGMPRILGANHHPEIVDRGHIMTVLERKRTHGEVTEEWYRERATTMLDLFHGEQERQSRLTSEYTLLGPLRHYVTRLVTERCGVTA